MKTPKHKYLKEKIGENYYIYYKIYGVRIEILKLSLLGTTPFILADRIIVENSIPKSISKYHWWSSKFMKEEESLTEEEWNEAYEELYNNLREYLRKTKYLYYNTGRFCCFIKVKEIMGNNVRIDRILFERGIKLEETEYVVDISVVCSSPDYYKSITEEEWNRAHENSKI